MLYNHSIYDQPIQSTCHSEYAAIRLLIRLSTTTILTQLCRLTDSIQHILNSNQCLIFLPNMLMKYLAEIILLTLTDVCQF